MDHSNTRLASQLDRNPGSSPSCILVVGLAFLGVFFCLFWFFLGFSCLVFLFCVFVWGFLFGCLGFFCGGDVF